MFNQVVSSVNNVLWGEGQVLIYMLLLAGGWFTFRLGFVQLRHFGHMFSLLKNSTTADKSGISSFQALCTSLSARVGTGNLAGVAIAISLGGAGAIFWMWVIALLGMATGFAESLLGQVYKVRDSNGEFRGGPAYYIQQGLGLRWFGILFSICLLFGYTFVFSATQANTVADALNYAYDFPVLNTGIVITVLAALVIMGGLRAIARFSEIVVPVMGLAYLVAAVGITLYNFDAVPGVLSDIVRSAFGLEEAAAGTFGAAIKNGIQRGLYSNEAGTGSVPQAAASASPTPNHPASQGYIQMLGVFFDTIVLCTCTAIIILLAGTPSGNEMEGIRLTQDAMSSHIGSYGIDFVSVAISLFAFTSIVANYAYAESNLHLFKLDTKPGRLALMFVFLSMMLWGTTQELTHVWAAADMAFGLMAVINIVAIVLLTPTILSISKDYSIKRQRSTSLNYQPGDCDIQGSSESGIWKDK